MAARVRLRRTAVIMAVQFGGLRFGAEDKGERKWGKNGEVVRVLGVLGETRGGGTECENLGDKGLRASS